jgi:hypothetical protein
MANQLLVGIFPSNDVTSLERAISSASGIDRSRVSVYTADPKTQAHEDSFLTFTHVVDESERDTFPEITHGTGLLTDFGGTDVPGINDSRDQSLTEFEEPEEEAPRYLASLRLPADEAENYDEALTDGRSVVVYPVSSDDEETKAVQALRAAGLRNVEAFPA